MRVPFHAEAGGHVHRHENVIRHNGRVSKAPLEFDISERLAISCRKLLKYNLAQTPDFDLIVTIMTSNNWPNSLTQSPPLCTLPESLATACSTFEEFYLARHNGRRLTWQLGLGNADLRVSFKSRKHDLNVSSLALVILLLFENLGPDDFLTYEVCLLQFTITMLDSSSNQNQRKFWVRLVWMRSN